MLSATLREGLNAYEVGPKLRTLRLKRKMGLVELGRHTGLSAALLSKIERGRLYPTLPTAATQFISIQPFRTATAERANARARLWWSPPAEAAA